MLTEKGDLKRESNRGPSAYQPSALPPGQAGSPSESPMERVGQGSYRLIGRLVVGLRGDQGVCVSKALVMGLGRDLRFVTPVPD